ncbi:hypothetical protein BJ508DRAFT_336073 [Ascobolus immersus RN42]|uniref:Uncharacterized protein n=1 Tax=Ascobolus immersus RN42 TaxID=1160509 RepID=A0A3N4H9W2_ASCIM|nr:hypothetical protein BJ508DRAFT_336073 [Ascobolus immersus RN42]
MGRASFLVRKPAAPQARPNAHRGSSPSSKPILSPNNKSGCSQTFLPPASCIPKSNATFQQSTHSVSSKEATFTAPSPDKRFTATTQSHASQYKRAPKRPRTKQSQSPLKPESSRTRQILLKHLKEILPNATLDTVFLGGKAPILAGYKWNVKNGYHLPRLSSGKCKTWSQFSNAEHEALAEAIRDGKLTASLIDREEVIETMEDWESGQEEELQLTLDESTDTETAEAGASSIRRAAKRTRICSTEGQPRSGLRQEERQQFVQRPRESRATSTKTLLYKHIKEVVPSLRIDEVFLLDTKALPFGYRWKSSEGYHLPQEGKDRGDTLLRRRKHLSKLNLAENKALVEALRSGKLKAEAVEEGVSGGLEDGTRSMATSSRSSTPQPSEEALTSDDDYDPAANLMDDMDSMSGEDYNDSASEKDDVPTKGSPRQMPRSQCYPETPSEKHNHYISGTRARCLASRNLLREHFKRTLPNLPKPITHRSVSTSSRICKSLGYSWKFSERYSGFPTRSLTGKLKHFVQFSKEDHGALEIALRNGWLRAVAVEKK